VDALNEDFAKQCNSFEDVNAMMDKKIADLKDFVSTFLLHSFFS